MKKVDDYSEAKETTGPPAPPAAIWPQLNLFTSDLPPHPLQWIAEGLSAHRPTHAPPTLIIKEPATTPDDCKYKLMNDLKPQIIHPIPPSVPVQQDHCAVQWAMNCIPQRCIVTNVK